MPNHSAPRRLILAALALVVLPTAATPVHGEPDLPGLRRELDALKAEVANLRQQAGQNWLDERRREEIKQLVHEVLSDAESRRSLAGGGFMAGHDGKHFFLAAEDNSFLMEISGQLQFRYTHQFDSAEVDPDGPPNPGTADAGDEDDGGFVVRRAKVGFSGHVDAGRRWEYKLQFQGDRSDGDTSVEDVIIKTSLSENWKLGFGKYKLPFLRDKLTSSSRLLAVERSLVTTFFTLDRSEQVTLEYTGDAMKAVFSINDGADEEFSTIGADPVELAVTGRIDLALAGSLKQIKDFSAWEGEPLGIFLGGAFHYQEGDGANADNSSESDADYFSYTVDGSIEHEGASLYAAWMGGHINVDGDASGPMIPAGVFDRDMYGFMTQGSIFLVPKTFEPFLRFGWLDDGVNSDATFYTFGANYYFKKHHAKWTTDIVYVADIDDTGGIAPNPFGNSIFGDGFGFSGDGVKDDTFLLRSQFQLLF